MKSIISKKEVKRSAAASEVGHNMNVANMQTMISFVKTYKLYNPGNKTISVESLQAKIDESAAQLKDVSLQSVAIVKAMAERDQNFKTLDQLSTSVAAALNSSVVDEKVMQKARSLQRKLRGQRAVQKDAPVQAAAAPADGSTETPPENTNSSASQTSMDNRLAHFRSLIDLVKLEPAYSPNEANLKPAALEKTWTDIFNSHNAVKNSKAEASSARSARNEALYHADDSLVNLSNATKEYVKSIYGTRSVEYRNISKLKFTRPRKIR